MFRKPLSEWLYQLYVGSIPTEMNKFFTLGSEMLVRALLKVKRVPYTKSMFFSSDILDGVSAI